MYKIVLLSTVALMLAGLAAVHSYLGERYLFARLFKLRELPLFRGDRRYTERVIRFAWHITGISWLGFALVLLLAAFDQSAYTVPAIAGILLVHGLVILATCGRRHPAWSLFILTAALILAAVWG